MHATRHRVVKRFLVATSRAQVGRALQAIGDYFKDDVVRRVADSLASYRTPTRQDVELTRDIIDRAQSRNQFENIWDQLRTIKAELDKLLKELPSNA